MAHNRENRGRPRGQTLGLLGLAVLGIGMYRIRRQVIGRLLGLRPMRYKVSIQRGLNIPAHDGVQLISDHYAPKGDRLFPTILIRTPYGRSSSKGPLGLIPAFVAQRLAERGYNALVQDVRGRFDSPGEFEPFVYEADDGKATLEWLEKQTWFNGVLGTWGQSYVGYTQWALAPGAPLYLKAMVPSISGSKLSLMGIRDGALELDTLLRWMWKLDAMQRVGRLARLFSLNPLMEDRVVARSVRHLPLSQIDQKALGRTIPYYQKWLAHPSHDDPYWQGVDHSLGIGQVTAAVHLVSGWYDFLLREALDDYNALRERRQRPYLTIGPWAHLDMECWSETLRQSLIWFDAHLKGDPRRLRAQPVRIYIMGQNEWCEMEDWPPPSHQVPYFLHNHADRGNDGDGILSEEQPGDEAAFHAYIYDPNDPTPAVGGPMMNTHAGPQDNRDLESRSDVRTFTTRPLENDVEIIGPVRLVLFVRSSREYSDFFGRVCDVDPKGRSMNVCDGLVRLAPGSGITQDDGTLRIEIDLWATAYRFLRSHRIRLQVSSGAHPRWSRNPGTGDGLASDKRLLSAEQTVYHDRFHPSALILPVTNC